MLSVSFKLHLLHCRNSSSFHTRLGICGCHKAHQQFQTLVGSSSDDLFRSGVRVGVGSGLIWVIWSSQTLYYISLQRACYFHQSLNFSGTFKKFHCKAYPRSVKPIKTLRKVVVGISVAIQMGTKLSGLSEKFNSQLPGFELVVIFKGGVEFFPFPSQLWFRGKSKRLLCSRSFNSNES